MEGLGGGMQKVQFPLLQHVTVVQVAVFAFSEHAPYGHKGPVCFFGGLAYQFVGNYFYRAFPVNHPGVLPVNHFAAPALVFHIFGVE